MRASFLTNPVSSFIARNRGSQKGTMESNCRNSSFDISSGLVFLLANVCASAMTGMPWSSG